jgi:hypothetical protein
MRKLLGVTVVAGFIVAFVWLGRTSSSAPRHVPVATGTSSVARAFESRSSDVQVRGEGRVVRILPDDNDDTPHQRFVLRLDSGKTVLIAHSIDIAARVFPLDVGDVVSFQGEYVWNPRGGLVHWTHRDPAGRHAASWLKHDNKVFD